VAEAAARLFVSHGYAGTTLQAIADAAAVLVAGPRRTPPPHPRSGRG